MFRFLRRHRTKLILLTALLLPLLAYRAHQARPGRASSVDRAVLALTMPLRSLLDSMVGGVASTWSSYADLDTAREDNVNLRLELLRLRSERDRAAALAALGRAGRVLIPGRYTTANLLTHLFLADVAGPGRRRLIRV